MVGTPSRGHSFAGVSISDSATVQLGDCIANNYQVDGKEEQKLFSLLYSNYHQDKDRNPSRVPGTCEWFLQHPKFKGWLKEASDILIVFADPGCGKSVLAKSIIDEQLCNTATKESTTCFFFFKDDDANRKSCATALRAILHGLFEQKPCLLEYLKSYVENKDDNLRNDPATLWKILLDAAGDPESGEIICILDALDEAEQSEQDLLSKLLGDFYSTRKKRKMQLKFLITSRPYSSIDRSLRSSIPDLTPILLDGQQESEHISSEINLVIEHEVPRISKTFKYPLKPAVENALIEHLKAIEHRTYLWLHLILDIIRTTQESTTLRLKTEIQRLPKTVDAAYERILERVEVNDRRAAFKLLHIIVGASRPLKLKELNIAARIEEKLDVGQTPRSIKDLDLEEEGPFEELVRNRCGLLVTVINQTVYFLHQTVKEFLLQETVHLFDQTVKRSDFQMDGNTAIQSFQSSSWCWKCSLVPNESSFILARVCMTYLLFTIFHDQAYKRVYKDSEDQLNTIFSFLDYAGRYWPHHFKHCTIKEQEQMSVAVRRLCNTKSIFFSSWHKHHHKWSSEYLSDPVVAWNLGLEHGLRNILAFGTATSGLSSLLRLAARSGNVEIVKLALEHGAEIDTVDKYGQTAIMLAAFNRQKEITRLLLQKKAGLGKRKDRETMAVMVAAMYGDKEIVQLILDNNADSNKYSEENRIEPSDNGKEDDSRSFLYAGADGSSFEHWPDGPRLAVLRHAILGENLKVYGTTDFEKLRTLILNFFHFESDVKPADIKGRTLLEFAVELYRTRDEQECEMEEDETSRAEAKERRKEILRFLRECATKVKLGKRKRSIDEDSSGRRTTDN